MTKELKGTASHCQSNICSFCMRRFPLVGKDIVLAHAGKVEVSSISGEGTKFMITLPTSASSSSG